MKAVSISIGRGKITILALSVAISFNVPGGKSISAEFHYQLATFWALCTRLTRRSSYRC